MSKMWRRLRVLLRRERFDSDLEEEVRAPGARKAMRVEPVIALRHE